MVIEKKGKKRGRPVGSRIRDEILVILLKKGPLCGYEVYKEYVKRNGPVNIRSIYYNLKKGVELGLLECKENIKKGSFSWGDTAKIKIYSIKK